MPLGDPGAQPALVPPACLRADTAARPAGSRAGQVVAEPGFGPLYPTVYMASDDGAL